MNLIALAVFPEKQSALEDRSAKYAVEGKSLYNDPDAEFGELQLLAVGYFEQDTSGSFEKAKLILDLHQVRLFKKSELPQLADEIREHGRVESS